jgi:hypothetical protein
MKFAIPVDFNSHGTPASRARSEKGAEQQRKLRIVPIHDFDRTKN